MTETSSFQNFNSQEIVDPRNTLFTNEQVILDHIPTTATLEYSKLQPAYRNVSLITTTIIFLILAGVEFGLTYTGNEFFDGYSNYIFLGLFFLYSVIMTLVFLGFNKKSYALRERDLVYNEGLIWQSSVVIPFNRVQHCEISQGPVERMFDLSELKIFTAGGASSDMSIPGLEPVTAERLKEYIVLKTGLDEEE